MDPQAASTTCSCIYGQVLAGGASDEDIQAWLVEAQDNPGAAVPGIADPSALIDGCIRETLGEEATGPTP